MQDVRASSPTARPPHTRSNSSCLVTSCCARSARAQSTAAARGVSLATLPSCQSSPVRESNRTCPKVNWRLEDIRILTVSRNFPGTLPRLACRPWRELVRASSLIHLREEHMNMNPGSIGWKSEMRKLAGRIGSLSLTVSFLSPAAIAQTTVTEAEAKMFAASAGYERFMGRWSRLLAPRHIAFAGVKNGDRVLDVGTGTGSVASAV